MTHYQVPREETSINLTTLVNRSIQDKPLTKFRKSSLIDISLEATLSSLHVCDIKQNPDYSSLKLHLICYDYMYVMILECALRLHKRDRERKFPEVD